jgi:hypothetical protein
VGRSGRRGRGCLRGVPSDAGSCTAPEHPGRPRPTPHTHAREPPPLHPIRNPQHRPRLPAQVEVEPGGHGRGARAQKRGVQPRAPPPPRRPGAGRLGRLPASCIALAPCALGWLGHPPPFWRNSHGRGAGSWRMARAPRLPHKPVSLDTRAAHHPLTRPPHPPAPNLEPTPSAPPAGQGPPDAHRHAPPERPHRAQQPAHLPAAQRVRGPGHGCVSDCARGCRAKARVHSSRELGHPRATGGQPRAPSPQDQTDADGPKLTPAPPQTPTPPRRGRGGGGEGPREGEAPGGAHAHAAAAVRAQEARPRGAVPGAGRPGLLRWAGTAGQGGLRREPKAVGAPTPMARAAVLAPPHRAWELPKLANPPPRLKIELKDQLVEKSHVMMEVGALSQIFCFRSGTCCWLGVATSPQRLATPPQGGSDLRPHHGARHLVGAEASAGRTTSGKAAAPHSCMARPAPTEAAPPPAQPRAPPRWR